MHYVLILYYSRHGSIAKLAQYIARGVETIKGVEAMIRTVPNVSAVSEATQPDIPDAGPPYVTLEDIQNCSGIILGSPTRFGNMAAPLKNVVDSLTPLWFSGALVNKPAAFFTSTSSLHGGQESTLLSMMIPFLHLGAVIVGIPYTESDLSTTHTGGTPYGATHYAGPNNKNPISEEEQRLCCALGKRVSKLSLLLKK
jgi:NAD(P)H dehydrogenase (quinone)